MLRPTLSGIASRSHNFSLCRSQICPFWAKVWAQHVSVLERAVELAVPYVRQLRVIFPRNKVASPMAGLPPTPDVITMATKQLNGPMCWASLPVRPLRNPRNLISQSRGRLTSQRATNDVTPAHAKHVRSLVQCFNQMER